MYLLSDRPLAQLSSGNANPLPADAQNNFCAHYRTTEKVHSPDRYEYLKFNSLGADVGLPSRFVVCLWQRVLFVHCMRPLRRDTIYRRMTADAMRLNGEHGKKTFDSRQPFEFPEE